MQFTKLYLQKSEDSCMSSRGGGCPSHIFFIQIAQVDLLFPAWSLAKRTCAK